MVSLSKKIVHVYTCMIFFNNLSFQLYKYINNLQVSILNFMNVIFFIPSFKKKLLEFHLKILNYNSNMSITYILH